MRRRSTAITIAAALILAASALPAVGAVGPKGSISGTVVAQGTASPVAGATVNLMNLGETSRETFHATVAADGTFTVRNIPQGLYAIAAVAHGYSMPAPGWQNARLLSATLNGVTVALKSGLSISGTVRGGNGKPLAGVPVLAVDAPDIDLVNTYSVFKQSNFPDPKGNVTSYPDPFFAEGATPAPGRAVSKPDGTFTIDGVVPGDYYVESLPANRISGPDVKVSVTPDQSVTGVHITFKAGAKVTGRLTHADGSPWADANVSLELNSFYSRNLNLQNFSTMTTTDADGTYAFYDVQPGKYGLQAWSLGQTGIGPVPLNVLRGDRNRTVNMQHVGVGRVTGFVRDTSGRTVAGVLVTAQSYGTPNNGYFGTTRTNAWGRYTIEGLRAGKFIVSISGYGGEDGAIDKYVKVLSTPGTSRADFRMKYSGKIAGTVKNADGSPGYGVIVDVIPDLPSGAPHSWSSWAYVQPDGTYEFDALVQANYTLKFEGLGQASPPAVTTHVNAGQTTVVDTQMLTLDHATVPGAVPDWQNWTFPEPEAIGVARLSLPDSDGGTPITGYKVRVHPGDVTCTSYYEFACLVSGLVGGANYTVDVTPVNAIGDGPTTTFTATAGPTDSVTKIVGKAAGRGQTNLSFVAPKTVHKIVDYKIETAPYAGATWKVYAHPKSSSTSRVLTGLTPKTTYLVRITPILDAGIAAVSKTTTIHTG